MSQFLYPYIDFRSLYTGGVQGQDEVNVSKAQHQENSSPEKGNDDSIESPSQEKLFEMSDDDENPNISDSRENSSMSSLIQQHILGTHRNSERIWNEILRLGSPSSNDSNETIESSEEKEFWKHIFTGNQNLTSKSEINSEFHHRSSQVKLFLAHKNPSLNINESQNDIITYNYFKSMSIPYIKLSLISQGKYKLEYAANIIRNRDYSIQAALPLAPTSFVAYYEVRILSLALESKVTIGLAKKNFSSNLEPGWVEGSIGYNSTDGCILLGNRSVVELNSKFGMGDVIGCGIRWRQNSKLDESDFPLEAFFTKNGVIVYEGIKRNFENIFPTIAMNRAKIQISFNQDECSFKKELQSMEITELSKAKISILEQEIQEKTIRSIIREYLIHEGYIETLEAFENTSNSDIGNDSFKLTEEMKIKLAIRNTISNLIINGKISEAISMIQELDPTFFTNHLTTEMILNYQLFIEYIREKRIQEALIFLQQKISKYSTNTFGYNNLTSEMSFGYDINLFIPPIHEITGLIAYVNPEQSPLRMLLDHDRRVMISELVKCQLKVTLGFANSERENSSVIEKLLRQLLVTFSIAFHQHVEKEKETQSNQSIFEFLGFEISGNR